MYTIISYMQIRRYTIKVVRRNNVVRRSKDLIQRSILNQKVVNKTTNSKGVRMAFKCTCSSPGIVVGRRPWTSGHSGDRQGRPRGRQVAPDARFCCYRCMAPRDRLSKKQLSLRSKLNSNIFLRTASALDARGGARAPLLMGPMPCPHRHAV